MPYIVKNVLKITKPWPDPPLVSHTRDIYRAKKLAEVWVFMDYAFFGHFLVYNAFLSQ